MNIYSVNGSLILAPSSAAALSIFLSKQTTLPRVLVCKPVRGRHDTLH